MREIVKSTAVSLYGWGPGVNPAKIDFNDELNALAHTRLEINAVPEQLAFFCCVKNSAQEKLSKMTIMSKNSVFRELCVLPVLLVAFKEYFFYHQLKYRVARHEVDLQAAKQSLVFSEVSFFLEINFF